MFEDLAGDVAVPGFESFAADAADLDESVAAACEAASDDTIAEALAAIDTTREQWLTTQGTWTGPAMERRSPAVVDWPVKTADIEALIERSGPDDITAEVIANNVGADTRGLTAMRWVLERDDAVELLADERWCDYVQSSAEVIAGEADLIVGDWTESWDGGEPFAEVVADEEQSDDWLEMLVNDNIFLVHKLTEEPREEGDVAPVDLAADRAAQMTGVASVFEALGPLLGDDLSERVDEEITAAREAFASGDIDGGRELAAAVEATLATEVAAQLDVTIGFSDADGDSAG